MSKKELVSFILKTLKNKYPNLETALDHKSPWELLIATILSAQCTDKQVNKVTPILFEKYPTPEKLGNADIKDIEKIVHSTGFYHNKARSIIQSSKDIYNHWRDSLPKTIKDMTTLPGVGRKTANVVLYNALGISEGIAVDTHVMRISNLLKLTKSKNPIIIEKDLMKILPKEEWGYITHLFIALGRDVCVANRPKCEKCPLKEICPSNNIK